MEKKWLKQPVWVTARDMVHSWEQAPVTCQRPIHHQDWDHNNLKERGYSWARKLTHREKVPSAGWVFSMPFELAHYTTRIWWAYPVARNHMPSHHNGSVHWGQNPNTQVTLTILTWKGTLLLTAVIHPNLFDSRIKNLQLDSSVWEIITGCAAGCAALPKSERNGIEVERIRCSPLSPKRRGEKFQQIMAVLKGHVRFIRNHAEHWESS